MDFMVVVVTDAHSVQYITESLPNPSIRMLKYLAGWGRVVALITQLIKTGVTWVQIRRIYAAPPPISEKQTKKKKCHKEPRVSPSLASSGSLMPARCIMQWTYLHGARLVSTSPREWIPGPWGCISHHRCCQQEKSRSVKGTRGKSSNMFSTRSLSRGAKIGFGPRQSTRKKKWQNDLVMADEFLSCRAFPTATSLENLNQGCPNGRSWR